VVELGVINNQRENGRVENKKRAKPDKRRELTGAEIEAFELRSKSANESKRTQARLERDKNQESKKPAPEATSFAGPSQVAKPDSAVKSTKKINSKEGKQQREKQKSSSGKGLHVDSASTKRKEKSSKLSTKTKAIMKDCFDSINVIQPEETLVPTTTIPAIEKTIPAPKESIPILIDNSTEEILIDLSSWKMIK